MRATTSAWRGGGRQLAGLGDQRRIDADGAQDLVELVGGEPVRQHVGVERVDDRVRFPVVAEQHLASTSGGMLGAALQQLGELVADLLAQVAELAAHQVLQLVLEDDAVVLDAVELQLLLMALPICGGLAEMK